MSVFDAPLVALDLMLEPARYVLGRAVEMAGGAGPLRVVHVVEPQHVQYSFDPTFTGSVTRALERDALDLARQRLAEICEPFGIPADRQQVVLGRTANQVHRLADESGASAIIIGSHSHGGWQWLLGSTANALLHGAPVDVVVVKVPEEKEKGR